MKLRASRRTAALATLATVVSVGVWLPASSGLASTSLAGPVTAAVSTSPPNILIINTDDQRYTESLAVMPKVRAYFADHGTEFVNGEVTTSLCCPSRTSFFSGRYSHNTGITGNGLDALIASFDQDSTIQGYLQSAGYNTAIVGKYLNTYPLMDDPENWTKWATTTGGYYDVPFNVNSTFVGTNGYYTRSLGDFASSFLQSFEAHDAKPWFMYLAPEAPHSPYKPSPKYLNAAVPDAVHPPNWNEQDVSDKPLAVRWRSPVSQSDYLNKRTQMLRTLMSVDDLVQRVTRQMKALGESQNTLAVFMSDNGYMWAEHRIMDKRFPYMESVEVPFLVRWPGHIEQGVTSTRLVTQIDLLPTALQAAQAAPVLTYPLDGQSLLNDTPRSEVLLEYFKSQDSGLFPWASLRGEDWQYVEWYDADTGDIIFREYYDLASDPYQMTNLLRDGIDGNEPIVKRLHDRLAADRTCVGTACP